jgi:GDP-D-mannose dehydratase
MTDSTNLIRLIKEIQPDEIYNLAAMSHVRVSFEMPEYVADTDGIGTLRLLEAVRILGLEKKLEFIKLLPLNYMERFKKFLKQKLHLFILALHMQ